MTSTVSKCGASRMRCLAVPVGDRRASRLLRPGNTLCRSMSNPAVAAVAARKSATRCSPARGWSAGSKLLFTLGRAINSRSSFWVLVICAAVQAAVLEYRRFWPNFKAKLTFGNRLAKALKVLRRRPLFQPLHKPWNAFLDPDLRRVGEAALGFGEVRICYRHVTGLSGQALEHRGLAERLLQQFDEPRERHGVRIPEVENLVTKRPFRAGHDSVHNVADESVIARGCAVAENRDRFSRCNKLGKLVNGKIRALARAVNGEEAKHRHVQAMDVVVHVAQPLASHFARRVRRNDRGHRVTFREWHLLVHSINGGGRGEDGLFHSVTTRGFQHVDCAFDVY